MSSAVTLRNGSEETTPLVMAVMLHLIKLSSDKDKTPEEGIRDILALWELREKCRNRDHEFFTEPLRQRLGDLGLIGSDGHVNSGIRNIVLCAVVGDGAELRIQNPCATRTEQR